VLLCVVLVVVGAAVGVRRALAWARSSEQFVVRAVTVHGAGRLDTAEVVRIAGVKAGMSLLDVNPSEIRDALRTHACIEHVDIRRWFTGRLSLRIRERVPVGVVNAGTVYQVDESGVLFDVETGTYLTLPVFSGLRDTVGDDGLRRLTPGSQRRLAAFRRAADVSDEHWMTHLSQVDFGREKSIRLTLDGYPAMVEIDAADVSRGLNQLRRLLEVLAEERDGSTNVERINLCHASMAYVKR